MILPKINPTKTKAWAALQAYKNNMQGNANACHREGYSLDLGTDIQLHYHNDLCDPQLRRLLIDLAKECQLSEAIPYLFQGAPINETENRAVLHTGLRDFSDADIYVKGENVKEKVETERQKIKNFTSKVHQGEYLLSTGKKVDTIVNIGIGGSDIGPKFVINALRAYKKEGIQTFFISNIDAIKTQAIFNKIDVETTLFVVVSKTFDTVETIANANLVKAILKERLGNVDINKHFVGVTTSPEQAKLFGVPEENIFLFWEWICGRFSMWGAVGLMISLALGYENFEALLKGANTTDTHFVNTDFEKNVPLIHALSGIWYTNFHHCQSQAMLPYNDELRNLKLYCQQASMESNGKSVDRNGEFIDYATSPIIWGALGNNAQHSFFQQLHQGTQLVPMDFLIIKKANHPYKLHQKYLEANYYAQIQAFIEGRNETEAKAHLAKNISLDPSHWTYHVFVGNKPLVNIEIQELTPENLGALVAMYEHTYFVQGIIWNIYSFDQWGVELGKELARKRVDFS